MNNSKQKKNILLFLKLPPPYTGATLMNQFVAESKIISNDFSIRLIPVSYKDKIEDTRILSLQKISTILSLYMKLFNTLMRFKPHLVYFQISPLRTAFFRDFTYISIIKSFGVPILYHMHGKGILEAARSSKLKHQLYSWAFSKSQVICLSESLIYDISEVYQGKVHIVGNAIPVDDSMGFKKVKQNKDLHILFLSNLIISKGLIDFLDALELCHSNKLAFKATIVGGAADLNEEMLTEEIIKRGLIRCVNYQGAKYGREKNEILRNTDLLVFPTYNDVWGLVILEAMQAGLPVITTREGAISEIVDDGFTGFLVEKQRPDQLAEKIELLSKDRKLRIQLGENGRKKFKREYRLDIFENKMKRVFHEVLGEE